MASIAFAVALSIAFLGCSCCCYSDGRGMGSRPHSEDLPERDVDLLEFALNLEYLEAEFFLYGSTGYGLDRYAGSLTMGGPPPFGARQAALHPIIHDIVLQFAFHEVGHLRAIQSTVGGFPRPFLNLSAGVFAEIMDDAFGRTLMLPFDPYANSVNFLLASYMIPYLAAGLLGVESGQNAVIRALVYERAFMAVDPYDVTVSDFTDRISDLRDKLGHRELKDKGLAVPWKQGVDGRVPVNILAGDKNSVAYGRPPEEILRIVYGSGNEGIPGGFYPNGADGNIARSHLWRWT